MDTYFIMYRRRKTFIL